MIETHQPLLRTVPGERLIAKARPAADALVPPGRCEPVTLREYPQASWLRRCWEWRDVPAALKGASLRRVAYHEAGHVVALEWIGLEVSTVTATPTGGLCQFIRPLKCTRAPGPDPTGELCATAAAVFHAGIVGEFLCVGEPWAGPVFYPGQKDYVDAEQMLMPRFGGHSSGAHAFAQQVALHVLSNHWQRLCEVAEDLMLNGTWEPAAAPKALNSAALSPR